MRKSVKLAHLLYLLVSVLTDRILKNPVDELKKNR